MDQHVRVLYAGRGCDERDKGIYERIHTRSCLAPTSLLNRVRLASGAWPCRALSQPGSHSCRCVAYAPFAELNARGSAASGLQPLQLALADFGPPSNLTLCQQRKVRAWPFDGVRRIEFAHFGNLR